MIKLAAILLCFALGLSVAEARTSPTHSPMSFDTRHDLGGYIAPVESRNRVVKLSAKRTKVAKRSKPVAVAKTSPAPASGLVEKARAYIGQTARQVGVRTSLWCSAFVRKITDAVGVNDFARSWLNKRHIEPQSGAIAILTRGRSTRAGHVGVVSGSDKHGNPIIISGNHGGRVAEAVYSKNRVLAYVSAK